MNYVGLSGGFGNLTLGRIWSASYNHAGVIRDFPNWHTSGDTSGRVGNAVSYAFSNETASFQIDAIMDGGNDTGQSIDQLEFGVTINLGDVGALALAYTDVENTLGTGMVKVDDPMMDDSMDDPMDNPMDEQPSGMKYRTNEGGVVIGTKLYQPGELELYTLVTMAGTSTTTQHLYKTPGTPDYFFTGTSAAANRDGTGSTIRDGNTNKLTVSDVPEAADHDPSSATTTFYLKGNEDEGVTISVKRESVTMSFQSVGTPGDVYDEAEVTKITHVRTKGSEVITTVLYEVHANPVYFEYDTKTGKIIDSTSKDASPTANAVDVSSLNADTQTLAQVPVETMEEEKTAEEMAAEEAAKKAAEEAAKKAAEEAAKKATSNVEKYGHTATHVSLQLNLGAMTGALGYSNFESNDPAAKQDKKVTFAGLSGSIGDTGMNWGAWVRNKEDHDGKKTNPWTVGLNKSLGDGAKAYIEHGNMDGSDPNSTVVGLVVNF